MSIQVAINHVTHYRYDRAIALGPQVIRLRPCPHSRTRILSYSLKVLPAQHFINWQQDPQSNWQARLVFPERTREFRFEVDLVAEMSVINPFDFFLEPHATKIPFEYEQALQHELAPYLRARPLTPFFARYLRQVSRAKTPSVDFLVALNQRIQKDIRYLIRMEPGVQTPEETLSKRSGSCRDSAWLMVQMCRHLGLAARFVSGYLVQLVPDVKSLDGPSGPEKDFTDLHAWCEVYLPGAGWIGLDPTSGMFAGEGHIPLACTPEPSSAAPVTGMVEKSECTFEHHMQVTRVLETPRVTKPYSDEQWREIEKLGHAVDAEMLAGDVRLTMGGEPTFVGIDNTDAPEWNTDALGPTKRVRAAELFHRLRDKYAPQGLVHFGQGKWYPGEQLPRWSLNCFWRRDGEPVWENPALIADETKSDGANAADAEALLHGVAQRLALDPKYVFDAYEDAFYFLWRERRLPGNVDPFDSRLDDALERKRLMRVFDHGLDKPVGSVLPIARNRFGNAWQSGPWFLRAERCYLVPGDSPIGYRLPLDSQPWVTLGEYPYVNTVDPSQPLPALPPHALIRAQADPRSGWAGSSAPDAATTRDMLVSSGLPATLSANLVSSLTAKKSAAPAEDPAPTCQDFSLCSNNSSSETARPPQPHESAAWITRTALCAQARNGVLYLFMPPLSALEDYLELVAAIEATAAEMHMPVLLEGYEPPADKRLAHFRVTPDPGVIEVNIHPAADWDDLVERTEHLYDAAHQTRLTTEKFMVDGRHTGTGGGNHFVLGGATVSDSPFLRRPDLLRSLIAYWHNHPSLSYLFSGLFIGPTSQAPRVDEARNDALYELEIAFAQIPDAGADFPPWLLDRIMRNLLVDVTGNTHRAEFCIDKLYSPDSSTGRLGLLEFRAFEMPPHARMSLAQQLLLRSLLARFWKTPYNPPRLARWGTELHDRFLLPHFVAQDFNDVITELNAAGYPLRSEWFAPHMEFRFPKYGDFVARGIEVELRHALEPWHVMGEEGGAGSTVRYVDSSIERVQIKVNGMAPDRYLIACNGKALPLQPTGTVGEFVAGVRYRAWQPSSCLHPTIPVHSPLVFDLVDTWMQRSLGGCQYHVMHPGGRTYDTLPVNAWEAESRRLSRFFRMGHTPGQVTVHRPPHSAEFPFTLDLRRV